MKRRALSAILVFGIACLLLLSNAQAATQQEITNAINKGLAWIASQQQPDGSWLFYNNPPAPWPTVDVATTGLVLLEFEKRAKDSGKNPFDTNPQSPTYYSYATNVLKGFNYLFKYAEGDSNGIHYPNIGSYDVYNTSIAMMPIAMSNDQNRVIEIGALYGKTYKEALQGMMNWMVFAQNKSGCEVGGWGYGAPSPGWADNSNSGYASLGIGFAADFPPQGFGLTIPKTVLEGLETFTNNVQVTSGPYVGGSIYNPCWGGYPGGGWVNILKTGNLLAGLGLIGKLEDDPRVQSAIGFIQTYWNAPACNFGDGCGWIGDYQAMFTMMKGLDIFGIKELTVSGNKIDWFDVVSTYIVNDQNPIGYWVSTASVEGVSPTINTAWALLTLERVVPGYVLNVPLYWQNDPGPDSWKGETLDSGRPSVETIGAIGCAITSLVMLVRSYGITTIENAAGNQVDLNPSSLNDWLNRSHPDLRGYRGYSGLNVKWDAVEKFTGGRVLLDSEQISLDDELLKYHRPVILKECSYCDTMNEKDHFVVARGKTVPDTPSDITIISPDHMDHIIIRDSYLYAPRPPGFVASTLKESINHSGRATVKIHKRYKPADCVNNICTIPPRLTFNIHSPAEILVTDPTGKSTGYDPNTGQLVTEIPDSTYEVEGGISDPENQDIHTPTFHSLFIPNPIDGTYQVTVIGTGAGPYTLEAGDLIVREAQGVIQPGDKLKYHFEYSTTDDNKIVLSLVVDIDIKPGSSPNSINLKSEGKIPVAILSTKDFNALNVNVQSLTFGRTGNERSLAFCNMGGQDVNGDGLLDLVCHFNTNSSDFHVGDTRGILKGKTLTNGQIIGADSVRIITK
jgi:hypothetical protein